MAENSKRERIISRLTEQIKTLPWVRTVTREPYEYVDDLERFAQTQFPVLSIVAGLPEPQETRRAGKGREYVSNLGVHLFVYALAASTPDESISSMADDVWKTILADPKQGGLALDTALLPETEKTVHQPYVGFWLAARVVYAHDSSGI